MQLLSREDEQKVAIVEEHFKCFNFRELKDEFEKLVDKGQKMECPRCKLAGRKDDNCTHMVCPQCACRWCYFCGKEILTESFAPHNLSWKRNESTCPLYLS